MRILLYNPSTGYYTRAISNPLGLLCIASFLKNDGHEIKLIDHCIKNTNIKKDIEDFRPDIIGISIMSGRGLKDSMKIAKAARQFGLPVLCGGYFPTMNPEAILDNGIADIVMCSEGELTFIELIEYYKGNKSLADINGIVYKENGKIVKTADRDFADLSDFPMIDWSIINPRDYFQHFFHCNKMLYLYSSKGCPCSCKFCSNHYYNRSTFRKRPNEYVIEEIKTLISDYGMDGVYFTGELWCLKKHDAYDFCQKVKENNLNFTWGMLARAGQYTREDFQVFREAGCRYICFGIETGSERLQKELNKNVNLEKARQNFEDCDALGITSVASFMIGLPGEEEEEIIQTIEYIKSIKASITLIYKFSPIKNTEIYNELVTQKCIFPQEISLESMYKNIDMENPIDNFSKISDRDLNVIKAHFDWKAFTGKKTVNDSFGYAFAFQTIVNGLKSISKYGFIGFFINGFKAFEEFIKVWYYSHCFGSVLKKYNLK